MGLARQIGDDTEPIQRGDLLSVTEAAARLGISTRTLERLKRDGLIDHCTDPTNRRIYFLVEQLDAFRVRNAIRVVKAES